MSKLVRKVQVTEDSYLLGIAVGLVLIAIISLGSVSPQWSTFLSLYSAGLLCNVSVMSSLVSDGDVSMISGMLIITIYGYLDTLS